MPAQHLSGSPKPKCPTHTPKKKPGQRESDESAVSNWSETSGAAIKIRPMEQAEMNYMCCDLKLSKKDSEMLTSRLKRFLAKDTRITISRDRSK